MPLCPSGRSCATTTSERVRSPPRLPNSHPLPGVGRNELLLSAVEKDSEASSFFPATHWHSLHICAILVWVCMLHPELCPAGSN